jgi:hypothetical protein
MGLTGLQAAREHTLTCTVATSASCFGVYSEPSVCGQVLSRSGFRFLVLMVIRGILGHGHSRRDSQIGWLSL